MNLIEIYIHEVTRRLPEKNREDIGLELRSTIEDMLPDDYSEEDVKSVLKKLGSPVLLASRYRDQPMHLIGPRYYDVYVSLLKMILPIAGTIALISMFASYFVSYNGEEAVMNVIITIFSKGIWVLIEVGMQVFFWLTLTFAIIERADKSNDNSPLTKNYKPWTPDDLKDLPYIPKKKAITKCEVFGGFLWTAIWASIYFYADHLVGVYEGGGGRLDFIMPALNQEVLLSYWPAVIAVITIEIALYLYKFIKGQWTQKMAIWNTAHEIIATGLFIFIISNNNLLQQEFVSYMADIFSILPEQFTAWLTGGIILMFVVFSILSIIDGFRKARIR
ncbi:HAAS signaling domain-containing protein [Niallia oryzisoli]|uniref:HAAS signaling domain-containing protein n=1 Tax=Niallia oryzisoli TaxID=1737571 RepID=UPI0037361BDE